MVSSIYYVTEKLNNISWQIGKNKGHEFEDFTCMVIEEWCLQIKTDHNWIIEQEPLPKILESQKLICHMLIADKLYYDGLDELCLMMKSSVFEKIVSIKGMNIFHNFLPPLHGKLHYQIIDEITNKIKQSPVFKIFYLYGQAGVGKTRIIEEISKKFNGTTTKSAFFICSLKGNVYSKVSRFLHKENLISKIPGTVLKIYFRSVNRNIKNM